jgi:hypothetical protein
MATRPKFLKNQKDARSWRHCCPCPRKETAAPPEQIPHCRIVDIATTPGEGLRSKEPVVMRRPRVLVPLDRTMQFPLTLAGELRTTFADVVSSPLPGRLAALVRRLQADRNESEERKWLRSPTAALFEDEQPAIIRERAEAALLIGGREREPIHLEGRRRTVRRKARWQPTTHTARRHWSACRSRSP